jgi:hypothetical protein
MVRLNSYLLPFLWNRTAQREAKVAQLMWIPLL